MQKMLLVVILGLILFYQPEKVLAATEYGDNFSLCDHLKSHDSCSAQEVTNRYNRFRNHPIVTTNLGDAHGELESFNDQEVVVFHGIRYAKPPVGDLRFAIPQSVDEDTIKIFGMQSAVKVACVQPKNFLTGDLPVNEDCLHLNIWTPLLYTTHTKNDLSLNQLPVMVWIHGGSFHIGSGNQDDFNGIVLSAIGEVVVVTLNYRLGFFGFLNTELESAAGNMGLYDQAAALKWVNENIENFGGNPNRVTIFGESAGGLSVGLLIVSPFTKNLFNRAIIESGSPYSPLRPEPKLKVFEKSLLFSKALNCSKLEENAFDALAIECLRNANFQTINDYGREEKMHSQILPNPMHGDAFVPTNVHILMKDKYSVNPNLEVLIGINEDEGFIFVFQQLRQLLNTVGTRNVTIDELHSLIKTLLKGRSVDPFAVTNFYFENLSQELDGNAVLDTIIDLYGDLYINCPVYFLAERLTQILGYERTFSYMLTRSSSQPYIPMCKEWSKTCHGDELQPLFGVPLRNANLFNDSDKELSKYLMRLWIGFAKTGKVLWTNYANNWFVEIPHNTTRKFTEFKNFHPEKTYACDAFWRDLFERQLNI
ncbi:Acetylcholinesterase-1 [Pseudolycoriella hygida]|uniref:Carboxylic ester hydrolase n=1 Tax=Pseudolycoriella hygida TaxID=35572 RepID=A0A9Q0MRJ1_9DIPT|nr:Acetylcholinesterase-1 [Pseudolycoriella hygida]